MLGVRMILNAIFVNAYSLGILCEKQGQTAARCAG